MHPRRQDGKKRKHTKPAINPLLLVTVIVTDFYYFILYTYFYNIFQ